MTTQHTKGPWTVTQYGEDVFIMTPSPMSYNIAKMQNNNRVANAHLISAAPDLLIALQDAQERLMSLPYNPLGEPDKLLVFIGGVIAKAKGEVC